jgi:hypothetical protein
MDSIYPDEIAVIFESPVSLKIPDVSFYSRLKVMYLMNISIQNFTYTPPTMNATYHGTNELFFSGGRLQADINFDWNFISNLYPS